MDLDLRPAEEKVGGTQPIGSIFLDKDAIVFLTVWLFIMREWFGGCRVFSIPGSCIPNDSCSPWLQW